MKKTSHILILPSNSEIGKVLKSSALEPEGFHTTIATSWEEAQELINVNPPEVVILGDPTPGQDTLEIKTQIERRLPLAEVILLADEDSTITSQKALKYGFFDLLRPPIKVQEVTKAVKRATRHHQRITDYAQLLIKRNTQSLQRRIDFLEAIQKIGRQVTFSLALDQVLSTVVETAVALTQAEEGSLLLLDEDSGELYIRAQKNYQEELAKTLRLPVQDSLAGQVLQSGEPLLLERQTPKKIKTSFMVYSIIYVPLMVKNKAIGVLEVDNRQSQREFQNHHVDIVSALADYAAIAIENAKLFSKVQQERNKLTTVLRHIEDGVVVFDHQKRIILTNLKAREALGITEIDIEGRFGRDVIQNKEILELLEMEPPHISPKLEFFTDADQTYNAVATQIPDIGTVITMQNITHFKKLDRIKTDFVNTVSHDLRSPLTAILGYIELLNRVGPLNDKQVEFVKRIETSVQSITDLINDLLDLGKIEAGIDTHKEPLSLATIVQYVTDSLENQLQTKKINLQLDIQEDLPLMMGNPLRLRQMMLNLVDNAIKYSPENGTVSVTTYVENSHIVIQVADNGPGIPLSEQPYIFDKFYRASNIADTAGGTGLGLAIVKSIVENHHGRIWVDSAPGKGSSFTIMLPLNIESPA